MVLCIIFSWSWLYQYCRNGYKLSKYLTICLIESRPVAEPYKNRYKIINNSVTIKYQMTYSHVHKGDKFLENFNHL